jgi:hypothetical protein
MKRSRKHKRKQEQESLSSSDDDDLTDDGFWTSLQAVLPFTAAGKAAAYAQERLDALDEMEAELNKAQILNGMIKHKLHDIALKALIEDTEGQMYHDFHRHRSAQKRAGKWSFVPPSELRRWKRAHASSNFTSAMMAHKAYTSSRRDKMLQIRDLCLQVLCFICIAVLVC